MTAPLLVIGYGNPSRGDDAAGPLLLARLEAWLAQAGLSEQVETLTDFQLAIEHALDLEQRQQVVFVDAALNQPEPFRWQTLQPAPDASINSHAMSPQAVLWFRAHTLQRPLPPTQLLSITASRFELGEPPGAATSAALDAAWPTLQHWCRQMVLAGGPCTN